MVELLGLLAYAELVSFFRLTSDAELAPSLGDKAELAGIAATEYEHYTRLRDHLVWLGADPEAAMEPFVVPLDTWHEQTQPQGWVESLVKAYVGDGIAGDFYRHLAQVSDTDTQELVHGVLAETGRADFVVRRVRAAIDEDPALAGRLALWARRLVGEALSQAQRVAMERPALARLVSGISESGTGEAGDLAAVGRVFARITDAHTARIEALGLGT
ncbi:ferritin-like fold-containing protein [Lipingzhangella sp. LS1_29]|uniref:Ferritin-like fold-containing protein n=1 Tax=Lipingzhangella rawalii TaxID=2055835 RepID=A0ABU2H376_9ACTN|nr:ferritin-like fold-containing protein [Lipingzhangella rawalii]MDS1269752.1 ferritin-like fold-containing protein [Lipingzhangella rawalii]